MKLYNTLRIVFAPLVLLGLILFILGAVIMSPMYILYRRYGYDFITDLNYAITGKSKKR